MVRTSSQKTSVSRNPSSIQAVRCPMVDFVGLISGKWAIPILYRLIVTGRPIRFGELQKAVAPITQRELTRQLRSFEQKGLVWRKIYAEIPPRVEYTVTALGKTLQSPLKALAAWMESHRDEVS